MFKGLSTLRKHERKAAANTEEAQKLQAYLSKYTSSTGTCQTCAIKGFHSVSEAGLLSCCTLQQDLTGALCLGCRPSIALHACLSCAFFSPGAARMGCRG